MSETTIALIQELQLIAKHNSPQRRAKLDVPLLTALAQRHSGNTDVGPSIDAVVAEAAGRPETAPLATLFPPSNELWNSNLSGRQRLAAAQVGMSYDSFRRRRNGQPSPYDDLCEALIEQLLRSFADPSDDGESGDHDPVTVDLTAAAPDGHQVATTGPARGGSGPANTAGDGTVLTTTAPQREADRSPAAAAPLAGATTGTGASRADGSRPRRVQDRRVWGLVAVCGLLVIAFVGAQQLRTDSSDPVDVETPVPAPAPAAPAAAGNDLGSPVGLVATPVGSGIEVSWMPASGGDAVDGYDITRNDIGYWTIDDPSIRTFTDDDVEPGASYTYAVTPWSANGSDDPADRIYGPATESVEVAASFLLNSLGQPIDLVASSSAQGIRLDWQPSTEGATPDGFDIARNGEGYWSVTAQGVYTFVDESVDPDTTYTYAVTPWLANGSGDPADRTYGPVSAAVAVSAQS